MASLELDAPGPPCRHAARTSPPPGARWSWLVSLDESALDRLVARPDAARLHQVELHAADHCQLAQRRHLRWRRFLPERGYERSQSRAFQPHRPVLLCQRLDAVDALLQLAEEGVVHFAALVGHGSLPAARASMNATSRAVRPQEHAGSSWSLFAAQPLRCGAPMIHRSARTRRPRSLPSASRISFSSAENISVPPPWRAPHRPSASLATEAAALRPNCSTAGPRRSPSWSASSRSRGSCSPESASHRARTGTCDRRRRRSRLGTRHPE